MSECRRPHQALAAWMVGSTGIDPCRPDARVRQRPPDIRGPRPSGAIAGPNPWRAGLGAGSLTNGTRFARRARC